MTRKLMLLAALILAGQSVSPAVSLPLYVDVGSCGPLQSGWTLLGACGTYNNVAGTGVNVTLATGNAGACECRNKGGSGPLANVESDLLFANDENTSPGADFILTLGNLSPGTTYKLLSYHHRSDESDTVIPGVTVTGATVISKPATITQSHAIMDNPAEIIFVAGAGNVEIRYLAPTGGCSGCQAFFNGFVLDLAAATVQFETAWSSGLETVTPAVLNVVLSTTQSQTVTVAYSVTGGTATGGGVDYTLASGTLVFFPGVTSQPINITVVNDGIDENDETIEVTLSNPTGGVQLGTRTMHTYTILDPRPTVGFDSGISGAREDSGSSLIPVSLSFAAAEQVSVDYIVVGGTASGGVDYILPSGTLNFAVGEKTKNIPITIVPDEIDEAGETVVLQLINASGATLGRTQHTFVITEEHPLLRGAFYFRADSDAAARVGPHPDIMVRLGSGEDKLIYRRNKGYLPVWYTESTGEQDLPVEVSRSNCENVVNPFSYVSIIETSPARAIVHWRYAANCGSAALTAWVDEYFTIYPDRTCIRTVKKAAGTTLDQWNSLTPTISRMQLLSEGVGALPPSWLNPAALSIISGNYTDEGFDETRRCYTLKCNVSSAPSVLNLTLDTTGGRSIHDPVIVIRNWGDAEAKLTVNGSRPAWSCIGYAPDMYGAHLVVWLGVESSALLNISITPLGGSGQFVNRPPPPDFGYDFDNDRPPLPMGSPQPGPFGAYYTRFRFNNKFDDYWRVGEHADVAVQFDDKAHRFVFWRGTNYCPHWVSDASETPYSNWYGTQFVERRASEWSGLSGCCAEPMQDWECRYSHVRIISSNPARAIVQWRYGPCDKNYVIPKDSGDTWGDWAEEYYTIYPDAISIRKVTAYSSRTGDSGQENPHIEFHEAIPITNPGTVPEHNIHWNALSMTDYGGNKKDWLWQDMNGGSPGSFPESANRPIMVVRMKGSTVPISIYEGTSVTYDPVDQDNCRPFNAYDDWPAWPRDDRSMGGWLWQEDPATHCYRNFWQYYPSHCSILHLKWKDYEHLTNQKRTKIMLFGMFDAAQAANVNNLIPLARSWEYAPSLQISTAGFTGGAYDKTERAYKITRASGPATKLELTLHASANSPVVNPCLLVQNWPENIPVHLTINGQQVEPGANFRQGIEKTADGAASLVVWIKNESTAPLNITIIRKIAGDFDIDGDVDNNDLRSFTSHWLDAAPGCQSLAGDWNHDCEVNFEDFALLAAQWLVP